MRKFEDWQFRITALTEGENTAMAEFDGSGYYTGRFGERLIDRAPLRLLSVCLFRIKNDKIVFVRDYLGHRGVEKQMTQAALI
ncbi:MAG: hypothetical protein EHM45_00915 [Desulfobacteraceae bacterium]|nr:MAG: hypothetical protein EHM45_00915 [Desulfobacteraceae bacterium]